MFALELTPVQFCLFMYTPGLLLVVGLAHRWARCERRSRR